MGMDGISKGGNFTSAGEGFLLGGAELVPGI